MDPEWKVAPEPEGEPGVESKKRASPGMEFAAPPPPGGKDR